MSLTTTCNELYSAFLQQLEETAANAPDLLEQIDISVSICQQFSLKLRGLVSKHQFINREEEVHFFKLVKPKFVSRLLFYKKIYLLYVHTKGLPADNRKEYYQIELKKITRFFRVNEEICRYYRTGSTYYDDHYFVRGAVDWRFFPDILYEDNDPSFTSCCDHKVSEILACDLMIQHLQKLQVESYSQLPAIAEQPQNEALKWTASKADLVEFIYALHAAGVLNNGQINIRDIAIYFQQVFQIDLGNYYNTGRQIRQRKTSNSRFLDNLKLRFEQWVNEQE